MKNTNYYKNQYTKYMKTRLIKKEEQLIDKTSRCIIALTLVVLHDKFGFGKTRLSRVAEEIIEMFKSIEINVDDAEKGCSFDDLMDVCEKEFDITLR